MINPIRNPIFRQDYAMSNWFLLQFFAQIYTIHDSLWHLFLNFLHSKFRFMDSFHKWFNPSSLCRSLTKVIKTLYFLPCIYLNLYTKFLIFFTWTVILITVVWKVKYVKKLKTKQEIKTTTANWLIFCCFFS